MPNFLPQRTRWYCYELMVRANTPGQRDGEVKYWIDGKLVTDFPNLNIRSVSTLKMDEAHIGLQAMHSERVNKKWYDNVVIATKYLGPMASASPTPSPTPTAQLQNISSRLLIQTGNNRNRRVRCRRNRPKETVDPRFGTNVGAVQCHWRDAESNAGIAR